MRVKTFLNREIINEKIDKIKIKKMIEINIFL